MQLMSQTRIMKFILIPICGYLHLREMNNFKIHWLCSLSLSLIMCLMVWCPWTYTSQTSNPS